MKIDSLKTPGLNGPSRPATRPAAKADIAAEAAGADVRLSRTSTALATQAPEINATRVQELRQAIAEGRFEINASAIAERLVSTARELLGARRQS